VSARSAWAVVLLAVAALVAVALATDLAGESQGGFWGDGATYFTMAWSLAEDGDLRYEARDPLRVRREFAAGAQGIFLKRSFGGLAWDPAAGFPWFRHIGQEEPRIYFAKPFTYGVLAAPFVTLLGTRGLLVTNALGLGLALVLFFVELRRQAAPGRAAAAALVLLFATVAPAYLFWTTPEAISVGMSALGLALWRAGWPLASAAVLGIATYSKPPNLFLALPLALMPLLETSVPWPSRLLRSAARGVAMAAAIVACYGMTLAVTGEWNYQGGRERKTFYGILPFEDPKTTFGNSGIWMSTNQVGPSVEGDEATSRGAEPGRSAGELWASFGRNLGYFWFGRFGGVVPYFFPAALAVVLFLALGPRDLAGWLALLALVVSWLFYIWMIPDNWYGGSGTLGNRYFVNLLPLAVLLIPRGRERLFALAGGVGGLVFVAPLLAAPVTHALDPGGHARRGALFRLLPAELTMLNDLAVFGEAWRKKRQVGDVDRDPAAYYLYFPDDGAFGREERDAETGFWLRGASRAEVFVRALLPVTRMRLRVTGAGRGDVVTVRVAGASRTLELAPNEAKQLVFTPPRGFPYKGTFVTVVHLRSTRASRSPRGDDPRELGAFVSIGLEVEAAQRTQFGLASGQGASIRPAAVKELAQRGALGSVPDAKRDGRDGERRRRERGRGEERERPHQTERDREGDAGEQRAEELAGRGRPVAEARHSAGGQGEVRGLGEERGPGGPDRAEPGDPGEIEHHVEKQDRRRGDHDRAPPVHAGEGGLAEVREEHEERRGQQDARDRDASRERVSEEERDEAIRLEDAEDRDREARQEEVLHASPVEGADQLGPPLVERRHGRDQREAEDAGHQREAFQHERRRAVDAHLGGVAQRLEQHRVDLEDQGNDEAGVGEGQALAEELPPQRRVGHGTQRHDARVDERCEGERIDQPHGREHGDQADHSVT
jgi:hypothetical protein